MRANSRFNTQLNIEYSILDIQFIHILKDIFSIQQPRQAGQIRYQQQLKKMAKNTKHRLHKTQIKHKLPKTQNTNPFVL